MRRVDGTVVGWSRAHEDIPSENAAFPDLDDAQLAVLAGYGTRRRIVPGEVLFSAGSAGYDFIVILSGSVEILGSDGTGGQARITQHGARRFLGEVSLVTRQRPVSHGAGRGGGRGHRHPRRCVPLAGDGRCPGERHHPGGVPGPPGAYRTTGRAIGRALSPFAVCGPCRRQRGG